ncbi:MAG: homoserine dehydrogenase [bacterium]|nr:homoserine dehydrogenase [bacterium]
MRQIKIGLFGLGTVGQSVVEQITTNQTLIQARTGCELKVVKAVVNNPAKPRQVDLSGVEISGDPAFILEDPTIDLVIELMGGCDLAKEVLLKSFAAGKPVVTANKALLAEHGAEVFGAAYQAQASLGFEAAVAGGIPVIRVLKEGLAGDQVTEVSGIINGTANYILTSMTNKGESFMAALRKAQDKGYAEADPTFDVEGIDTAHKLLILMNLSFGGLFDFKQLYTEGITGIEPVDIEIAAEFGYVIKLLGKAIDRGGRYEGRVHPTLVPEGDMLANVEGPFNAVSLQGNFSGPVVAYGRGAGGHPTASAVLADVVAIVRQLGVDGVPVPPLSMLPAQLEQKEIMPIGEVESEYYLRFSVEDRVGVMSEITRVLGEHDISIASMIQKTRAEEDGEAVPVVIFTHLALEMDVVNALLKIDQMPFIAQKTRLIRVDQD